MCVCCACVQTNETSAGSGGRDAKIINYDLRMANPRVRVLQGHQQEVNKHRHTHT